MNVPSARQIAGIWRLWKKNRLPEIGSGLKPRSKSRPKAGSFPEARLLAVEFDAWLKEQGGHVYAAFRRYYVTQRNWKTGKRYDTREAWDEAILPALAAYANQKGYEL